MSTRAGRGSVAGGPAAREPKNGSRGSRDPPVGTGGPKQNATCLSLCLNEK
jgi:hypothetical protein